MSASYDVMTVVKTAIECVVLCVYRARGLSYTSLEHCKCKEHTLHDFQCAAMWGGAPGPRSPPQATPYNYELLKYHALVALNTTIDCWFGNYFIMNNE